MNIKKRLKEIGRGEYQGFLAMVEDCWKKQLQELNNTLGTQCFRCNLSDLQEDFENYTPKIVGNIAYFPCDTKVFQEDWEFVEIGIPSKIWWRFLYQPKTTFVSYTQIVTR